MNDLEAPFSEPWNSTPGWWASRGPPLGLERKPAAVRILTNIALAFCALIVFEFFAMLEFVARALGLDFMGLMAATTALIAVPLISWDFRVLREPHSWMALPVLSCDLPEVRDRISRALTDNRLGLRSATPAGTAFARWRDHHENFALTLQPPDGQRPPFLLFTGKRAHSEFVTAKGAIEAALFPDPEPADDWSRNIVVETSPGARAVATREKSWRSEL